VLVVLVALLAITVCKALILFLAPLLLLVVDTDLLVTLQQVVEQVALAVVLAVVMATRTPAALQHQGKVTMVVLAVLVKTAVAVAVEQEPLVEVPAPK
jgi:hypothetical protein